jgi:peptidyl-prolyl cis-trans isomerase D
MLQDIRKSTRGTTAKIVVGLIVVSFSIFGIESILVGGSGGGVAEVNGEHIYIEQVEQLVNSQKRRLIAMMGENLDPAMLDDQRLSAQALENLITRKLQMQSAANLKLGVSEQQIGAVIGSMEQFQVDGQFSPEMYKSLLSGAGYTPALFKQGLQDDLIIRQLSSGLAGSDFATPAELQLNAAYTAENRDVRYLTIPLERFSVDVEIDGEAVAQYYQDNQAQFQTPEAVELDYIQLTVDEFRQPVEESLLFEQYELEKENSQYQTQSGVSHILFEQGTDESNDAFQVRIVAVQDQLAMGADFAELAKTVSDDIGSASYGGDLGFTQGDAFPAEMEEVIAQLEIGAVSEPVETDAGIHLIKLVERRSGEIPPFEEMRADLEDRLQTQEARRELALVVEELKDLAFNAEDLSAPAEELGLDVMQSGLVSRSQVDGLFANASLLETAFSEDVLELGHNSDVIELSGETYVALRVRSYHEPEMKPLEAVRAVIVTNITDDLSRTAVVDAANEALAQLRAGASLEAFSNDAGYEWQVELAANRTSPVVPQPVLQRAFELQVPADGESTFDYVFTPTGDAQVLELVRVTPGAYEALNEPQKTQLKQQITAEYGRMVNTEFQRGLRDRADITVL